MLRLAGGVGLALMLGACAGRAPHLPPLVLASDQALNCEAIQAETHRNSARISTLATEESLKLGQNVVAGAAGFVIWPAWLALDFQNAAGKESQAFSQRNAYLASLAGNRCNPGNSASTAALPLAPTTPSTLGTSAGMSTSLVSY
ncbi:hypothetical protein W911_01915 [Hyphomicrobium nitrativorans NL23]|uniref:Lipoprotein n=1 Tax=Hyphomicrobium nitrativorans NL23 TaxID=1029756 RepID=V5SH43_9HYPH|nr:hypothetical protein [Hyphomicrobium nitrativorans]AHB49843.1 hypothetical protein W911_01915 [Hyphomicrobium nitrativorans NL23]